MIQWPWQPRRTTDRLAVCSLADSFAYAQADTDGRLQRCGIEQRGRASAPDFARRLRALGLPSRCVSAVLPLAEGQLVQIEAPAVKPEEMKAAARWRAKDLVEGRIDDLTLDVMAVGDERARPTRHLFVAAARNAAIRETSERTRAAGLEIDVVELVETAQRNLQSAVALADGLGERATAALVRYDQQCLLTICAGTELYYARRLKWEGLALPGVQAAQAMPAAEIALETMDFVDYGADTNPAGGAADAPRLVIELQRSFDVWERSWPDLPLAAMWAHAGDASAPLASMLEATLGLRVAALAPERVFPGFEQLAPAAALRAALLPMLGALLRSETRQL